MIKKLSISYSKLNEQPTTQAGEVLDAAAIEQAFKSLV